MKEIDGDYILQEVGDMLEKVECDYIFALFPSGDATPATASIGLNLTDTDQVAYFIAQLIMRGDDLGWSLLELLQKTCRTLPLPLHHLLSASYADYKELTTLYEQEGQQQDSQKKKRRV